MSKKKSTVETAVIGAEFFAMKQGVDALQGSVIYNSSKPESVLRKKRNSACYHAVRKSVAMGESLVGHIPSKENVTDLLTKVTYGHKRRYLVSNVFHDIHDNH